MNSIALNFFELGSFIAHTYSLIFIFAAVPIILSIYTQAFSVGAIGGIGVITYLGIETQYGFIYILSMSLIVVIPLISIYLLFNKFSGGSGGEEF